ncbi:methyltransferase family protein [Geothermobacter ehrlichii]|uniref:Methyltransferase family protein n=2 Tax=Geothermobacter ehrlichii TaxID=213224 RepID=A0A5D3WEC5_9BACT|nr:methyltransferase family protein [Geothermobacter ehrlichii]
MIRQNKKPIAAGKSSFDLIEPEKLFAALQLEKDVILLDAACGRGAYALAAAEYIKAPGRIYAVDLWAEGITFLQKEACHRQLPQIVPRVADLRELPLPDASVDICLLATVLHDLVQDGCEQKALQEICRVLKPDGRLVVIEFHKIDGPPGPPKEVRLSPDELAGILCSYGFTLLKMEDVGPFNYSAIFGR